MSASATVAFTIGGHAVSVATAAAAAPLLIALPAIAYVAYSIYRNDREAAAGEAAFAAIEAEAACRVAALMDERRARRESIEAEEGLRDRARDLFALAKALRREVRRIEGEHPQLATRLRALGLPETWEEATQGGLAEFIARATPALAHANEELASVNDATTALLARKVAQAAGRQPASAPEPPPADPRAAALVARIEERCSVAEVAELAPWIGALQSESNPARVAALSSELRAQEQQVVERRERRERDRTEALALIDRMPPVEGFDLEKLHHQLLLVVAGEAALTDTMRTGVQAALAEAERAMRAAAAEMEAIKAKRILEGALRDLGYETEEIQHTLFTEGGVAYFQGQAWGDYFIRLKVDAEKQAANFGLVRATDDTGQPRAVKDDLVMENEWCSGSGRDKLFSVLRDRGMDLEVKKVFDIGALPVELVSRDTVPQQLRERVAAKRAAKARSSDAQPKHKGRQIPRDKS
jgi:hypothetical protein